VWHYAAFSLDCIHLAVVTADDDAVDIFAAIVQFYGQIIQQRISQKSNR